MLKAYSPREKRPFPLNLNPTFGTGRRGHIMTTSEDGVSCHLQLFSRQHTSYSSLIVSSTLTRSTDSTMTNQIIETNSLLSEMRP